MNMRFIRCYWCMIFESWNFEKLNFWKFSTHSLRFLHSELRLSDVKKTSRLTSFRGDVESSWGPREASGHLTKKKDLSSEVISSWWRTTTEKIWNRIAEDTQRIVRYADDRKHIRLRNKNYWPHFRFHSENDSTSRSTSSQNCPSAEEETKSSRTSVTRCDYS